jgi:hypothetical protein
MPVTTTYRVEFFTAADYAWRHFEAATPEQALQLAHQFYEDDLGELDFRSYDDNASLDQIDIWETEQSTNSRVILHRALTWESDDFRLRRAAPELLAALKLILPCYADLLRGARADLNDCEHYQNSRGRNRQSRKQGVIMPLITFRSRYTEHRAIYSYTVNGNVIAIIDHDQGKSVTNDADNVIADLAACFDLLLYRVIYRDTRGIWDQMLVDRTGRFAGFSSINERDLPAALTKITRH